MQFPANNQRGHCASCGKEVPVRDIRDRKPNFCDQKCASLYKFGKRYRGGTAHDKPNIQDKGKQL